ncbi:pyridoxamine 5'-phosphate oxidase family protein [Methanolobus sp. ZRKC2]|uniref:pyridoxamine 5'-phosphate oxidase family protein n=1 Tax=Methanolobus sp. ZRKC2 TaxID=3125783 RepID=UPI00324C82EA
MVTEMSTGNLKENLKFLMKKQKLAVLATCHEHEPHTNLVAFVTSDDLKYVFFVTQMSTRKYSYLTASRKASIMIDNRSNNESDFRNAMAVNISGSVDEVEKTNEIKSLYLKKHPYLLDFLQSPSSAIMRIEVKRYVVASRFQNVVEIGMS